MRTTQTTPGVLVLGVSVDVERPNTTNAPTAAVASTALAQWSFAVAAYTSLVPAGHGYIRPTLAADRGQLHLEARYRYEAPDTTSRWASYKFGGSEHALQTKPRDRLAATAT